MTYPPTWTDEHDAFLKDCLATGMSTRKAAIALNEKFRTCYTRNAVIGRVMRRKLRKKPDPEPVIVKPWENAGISQRAWQRRKQAAEGRAPAPRARPMKPAAVWVEELRCAEVEPLHVSLIDLEFDRCRWPYGDGRDEPYTFCGHPIVWGSYCGPHYVLSVGSGTPSERQAHHVSRKVA